MTPPVCPSCGRELPTIHDAELACPCGSLLRLRTRVDVVAVLLEPPPDLVVIRPGDRAQPPGFCRK